MTLQKGKELQQCLQLLAGDDTDGATVRNNVGFNKLDSQFGKLMAQKAQNTWDDGDIKRVYRLLYKYRKQLSGFGVKYDELPYWWAGKRS